MNDVGQCNTSQVEIIMKYVPRDIQDITITIFESIIAVWRVMLLIIIMYDVL